MEDMGAGLVVIEEDEAAELIYEVEDETAALDDTVEHVEQGGSSKPPPIPRQNQSREGTGVRKRVASDSSSNSNASSRNSDSIRGNYERLNTKTIMTKRRRRSWREGEVLERHRHHSLIGICHPMISDRQNDPEHEVYLEQGARDRAREAAGARQGDESGDECGDDQGASARQGDVGDDERDDDQDANDPLARQDDERDDEQDATTTQDDERDDDQDANDPRRDIQARLRRAPHVIIADTYANRPGRTRRTVTKYQAGDTKKAAKRLGRGRGPGRG